MSRRPQTSTAELGSPRHLASIVGQHKLRRGRVDRGEVIGELLSLAADRQRAAAGAHEDAMRLLSLAAEIRSGAIELPEPQPLEELTRARRRHFMERA
ncbi:MAG: hypothetical protein RLO01_12730 [Thalassobaculaceae bacterium]